MNKRILIAVLSMLFVTTAFAQTTERTVESFDKINISSALKVILIQAETEKIEIIGVPEQYLENLITETKNGTLTIYVKAKVKGASDMQVNVHYTSINNIEVSGAATVESKNTINSENLTINSSGATELDFSINAQDVSLTTSGASAVTLKGVTKNFTVSFSGASELKAQDFEAKKVDLSTSGAASVKVWAVQEISGVLSGVSEVKIYGNPLINTLQKSGLADIKNADNVTITLPNDTLKQFNSKSKNDTTRIKWGGTMVLIIDDSVSINKPVKKRRNHWAGIDLGINGFVNANNSLNLNNPAGLDTSNPSKVTQFMELDYAKSWTVSINFYEQFIKLYKHHVGLVTGLGIEYNNYELKHNVQLISKGGSFVHDNVTAYNENYTWGVIDTNINYSKNRFKTFYINAPLLLEFNTGQHKNKSFHFAAGAIVGYKFTTKMKYKYKEDGDTQKYKDNQDFNTNPFRVSLTARVGYGRLNLFATYGLTPLFEKNRGPELHAFSIGMTLLGF